MAYSVGHKNQGKTYFVSRIQQTKKIQKSTIQETSFALYTWKNVTALLAMLFIIEMAMLMGNIKCSCKMPNPDNSTLFFSIFLPIVQNNLCVVGEKSGLCPHLCAKLYCHILLSSMFKIYDILWGQYHLFSFCIIPSSLFLSLFSFLYGLFDQRKNWKTKRKYLFLYASTVAQQ